MKDWKRAKLEAAGRLPAEAKRPNQILREAGYGDSFFGFVSRGMLRVADAELKDGMVKVTLMGATQTANKHKHVFKLMPFGTHGDDAPVEHFGRDVMTAHNLLSQSNPCLRGYAYTPA